MRAVFVHDQEAAAEGIRSGERLEAMDSEYGRNDLLVDFLREVFLPDRRIYAVMSSARFADLVKERALDKLQRLVQSGVTLEDAITEVKREL